MPRQAPPPERPPPVKPPAAAADEADALFARCEYAGVAAAVRKALEASPNDGELLWRLARAASSSLSVWNASGA